MDQKAIKQRPSPQMQAEMPCWHGKLYALSFAMFGARPWPAPDHWAYGFTIAMTLLYCAVAAAISVALNIATLPFGVYAEPAWRPRARFYIIRVAGIPILPFSTALGLGYATFETWISRGPLIALGAWLFVPGLGVALLGAAMAVNRLHALKLLSKPPNQRSSSS
jgi:hypothetical protein